MIDIVLDVVRRTSGGALALEYFVGAISTHVAVDIQLVVADRTSAIASPTELLIIRDCSLSAFASHETRTLRYTRGH
jgi:hypothetical protein